MKVRLIAFFPDNTHLERNCTIMKDGRIKFDKVWKPQVIAGLSQFKGRKEGRLSILKKPKTRYFALYGEPYCYTIDEFKGRLNKSWNKGESQEFIKKLIAWASVSGKPFETWQILLLFGGLAVIGLMVGYIILRIM